MISSVSGKKINKNKNKKLMAFSVSIRAPLLNEASKTRTIARLQIIITLIIPRRKMLGNISDCAKIQLQFLVELEFYALINFNVRVDMFLHCF